MNENTKRDGWLACLQKFDAGEIGYEEFVRESTPHVRRYVSRLRRKLSPMPEFLTAEDLEQEFWLQFAIGQKRRGEAKGAMAPRTFMWEVGKVVQKARGVNQHRRTGKPCFDLDFSNSIGWEVAQGLRGSDASSPERHVIREESYRELRKRCATPEEEVVVEAIYRGGGTEQGAVVALLEDREARRDFVIWGTAEASRMVDRTVRKMCKRNEKEAVQ